MTTLPPPGRPSDTAGRNARPYLYGEEADAVAAVLRSGHYGHTDVTTKFEAGVAKFLGVNDAVAINTGTTALHIALRTAGIGHHDEVIVPSLTFCATIQAILSCGARPRFIEINPDTLCIEPSAVRAAITSATRAVVPVLYGGRAIDLSSISDVLTEHGVDVIEDAAHAFGSYNGTVPVGAGTALTCFSFGPIKNLTCGQGGMIIPRNSHEARMARSLRNLGISMSADRRAAATSYAVSGPGMRGQMQAVNAAIGLAQLPHFSAAQRLRKKLWQTYADALKPIPDVTLVDVDVDHSTPSLCVVRLPAHLRDGVFHLLKKNGVGVGVHYPPNHLQPAFQYLDRRSLPVTEQTAKEILTLPFHQHLGTSDITRITELLDWAMAAVEVP